MPSLAYVVLGAGVTRVQQQAWLFMWFWGWTRVPVSGWQALYRLSHLLRPQNVFCFHGISDIAFLFFKSLSEGNEFSGWTMYPDLSASLVVEGLCSLGWYTFWAVLWLWWIPITQDFRFRFVGRHKGWGRVRWATLVSIYKSSDICFLRTGYVCANCHCFVTSLAPGALWYLLPLTYVNFYPSHYSLGVITDSRSGLWKATFTFYIIWWFQLIP